MSDNSIFRVQVLEGRGFGEDPQTLLCTAQFVGETKSTQYSVNTDTHIWNSTLSWNLTREELRKAHASGSTHCKISVLRKDGKRLGWVVVSLRSAKLQSQYKSDPQGQWMQLNASKLADPPQLRIAYALCEERLLSQLDNPLSSLGTAAASGSLSKESSAISNSGRRRNSSSSAAASLRPSKSLTGKQRLSLSAAISDTSSWTSKQQELDATPAASPTATACLASADVCAARSHAVETGEHSKGADIEVTRQQKVDLPAESYQQKLQQHQLQQEPLLEQQQEQEPQQHSAEDNSVHGLQHTASTTLSDAAGTSHSLHDAALATPTQTSAAADAAATGELLATADAEAPAVSAAGRDSVSVVFTQDDLVAAAEASLPTFAQRHQQQQLSKSQHVPELDSQQQQQQQVWQPQQQQVQPLQQDDAQEQESHQTLQQQAETLPQQQQQQQPDTQPQATSSNYSPPECADQQTQSALIHQRSNRQNTEIAAVTEQAASAAGSSEVLAAEPAQPLADPVRQFVFTLDVRSFQAGRRLPVALASTYVTAFLPQEFIAFLTTTCGAKLPPKLTPLRTLPAVDVLRGSEGGLPNGCASVSFASGVVGLAGLLSQEPRVVMEVWHREKLRSDTLLGVASVSLSALLQECWVDGYAPVYALMTKATGGQQEEEKVQVGMLRVALSLEDKGPPAIAPTAAMTSPTFPGSFRQHQRSSSFHSLPSMSRRAQRSLTPPKQVHPPAATDIAASDRQHAERQQELERRLSAAKPQQQQPSAKEANSLSVAAKPDDPAAAAAGYAAAAAASMAAPPGNLKQMPEYLAAWELEVWKRAEKARFQAELKDLEQQRMAVIEAQWWKRERAREHEVAVVKAEYAKLEQQTKALLSAVQDREAKLVAAEADLQRRQSDLERQHAARMSEAEAAVRRLQVECEHQLSLERDRTAAVARQRDAAEARLLAAEARAAAMESQFMEYRAAQRATPEAQLQLQLQEAQAAAAAAQARATKAVKARKHYKEQVMKLAREITSLHQQRQQDQLQQQQRRQEEAKIREQSSAAAAQAAELSGLHEQLAILRAAAMAAAAADSPVHLHSPASSDPGWPQQQRNQAKHKQRHRHDKENDYQQQLQDSQLGANRHKQSVPQASKPARCVASTAADVGQAYSDVEENFSNSGSSDQHSDAGGDSEYDASSSEDDKEQNAQLAACSRRARLQKLQKQNRRRAPEQSEESGDRLAAAAGAVGAAADAALAEVAALAAILNQPKPSLGQAQEQQCQPQSAATSPGSTAAKQQRMTPGPVLPGSCSGPPEAQQGQHGSEAPVGGREKQESHLGADPLTEVRRLLKEKVELLASGLYDRDDAVILQIDARVQALAELQLAG